MHYTNLCYKQCTLYRFWFKFALSVTCINTDWINLLYICVDCVRI